MSDRRRHVGTREAPQPTCCLGVFGLSLYTTERELKKEFSRFGPLERVQVVLDGKTGRSRGFAFVYFESQEDAKAAKEALCDQEIDGRRIRVDFSITKRPHTPTPGVYMGRPTYSDSRGGRGSRGGGDRGDYGGRGGGGGDRGGDRGHRRSPSPYYRGGGGGGGSRRRDYRSRSRSYSPRDVEECFMLSRGVS
ncbi:LOW QUALITY PROTEIN: transformer-2 protein homolog beta-like [Tigriopus californicus]|uniref:LOW QUALITY PROTEIN: transformer-2 protein homolog beta-like n=1 Tax=Tigriopus californicus TaxID=6832 RepID=UPI0027DA97C4|nr:LOW QUALITY PROTEIN: transformer-2 protein homolog beta-like [Tigriopus californicus]